LVSTGSGTDIIETPAHNFILTASDSAQIAVLKVDSSGNVLWRKMFGLTTGSNPNNSAYDIIKITDERYLITGRYEPGIGGYNLVYAIMIDSSGNSIWEYTYGINPSQGQSATYDSIESVIYIVGLAQVSTSDVYLVKVDTLGNMIWENYYDLGGSESGIRIKIKNSNEILVLGSSTGFSGNGMHDGFLMNVDSTGSTHWLKNYGGPLQDIFNDIRLLPDSGILVLGTSNSISGANTDAWLLRLNKLGDTLWTKTFGYLTVEFSYGFDFNNLNSIWICGKVVTGTSIGSQGWIFEIDTSGNVLFSNQYGSINDETFQNIIVSELNSVFAIGATISGPIGSHILMVRIDSISTIPGIISVIPLKNFEVFPNPTSDAVAIYMPGVTDLYKWKVSVFDLNGCKIVSTFELTNNGFTVRLPQTKATYFVVVNDNKSSFSFPIIKN
jgi:hypothetical protein